MVRKIARRSRSYPKIDVHTHVALPEVLALASKVKIRGKEPGKQHWVPSSSRQEHGRQSSTASATLTKPKPRLKDMDRMDIFISSAFSPGGGFTSWTSNEMPHATAAIYYYRYGHANSNHKEDITKDSVRAVRDIEVREKAKGVLKKYPGFSDSPLPR